jgi:hypothetical protein
MVVMPRYAQLLQVVEIPKIVAVSGLVRQSCPLSGAAQGGTEIKTELL